MRSFRDSLTGARRRRPRLARSRRVFTTSKYSQTYLKASPSVRPLLAHRAFAVAYALADVHKLPNTALSTKENLEKLIYENGGTIIQRIPDEGTPRVVIASEYKERKGPCGLARSARC